VKLSRAYVECVGCGEAGCPLDERLGIEGSASREAERLMCLVSTGWGFALASQRLKDLLGWTCSGNTLRQTCYRRGVQMAQWRESQPEALSHFRHAQGDVEFETDGTCINTTAGWKEMRLGIFAKRHRGQPATIENWDQRALPRPHARLALAAMESSRRFGRRWRPCARRLGIFDASQLTVLGDGAKWIWEEKIKHLRGSEGVLDVFHALEHVHRTSEALFGERNPAAATWADQAKDALLRGGWRGIDEHLSQTRAETRSPRKRKMLQKLVNYLAPHADHLNYPERMAAGRTIGSGLVEGGCKQIIGRRLKQTGARWRPKNANHMATLCSTAYSDHWDTFWNPPIN